MRKLLLILMLACLLWGMALPAAAEGEGAGAQCGAGCILAENHAGDCVTVPSVEASDTAALNAMLDDMDSLIAGLRNKYPRFAYAGGDLTIRLPAGSYGDIACGEGLDDGAELTLLGAADGGSKIAKLTISAPNLRVDGIVFTAAPAVATNTPCAVVNCTFGDSGDAFLLRKGEGGGLPGLQLSGNTYHNNGKTFAMKVDYGTGEWNVTVPADVSTVDGAVFAVTPEQDGEKATKFNFQVGTLADNGWAFAYTADCDYETCYIVNGGKAIATGKTFTVNNSDDYYVVSGTMPAVVKKDASTKTMTVDQNQSKYLGKLSLKCDFKAVKVTNGKGTPVYFTLDSEGVLTFNIAHQTADTYTITEVKTTTIVTKTTTTSRKYTSKYEDCFPVTPQSVSNAMRSAQDGLVTLICTDAGRKPVSLPTESMATAAEKGYRVLVKTKYAELTLDAAALKSLAQQAKGTTVLLDYKSLNHKTLSTVGQMSLQSHLAQHPNDSADLAFLVTASSDSENIEDLQQGTVTLKIPFIVLPGTEDQESVVYALQGEHVTDARDTTVADGHLTTKLLDLTEHMVFQISKPVETTMETTAETTQPETTQPQEPEKPEGESGRLPRVLLIILGILLAVLSGVLGVVFLRRREK